MHFKLKVLSTVFFTLFLLQEISLAKDNLNKKISYAVNILNQYHYRDLKLDRQIANEIKRDFINSLDPRKIYFLDSDLKKLINIKFDLKNIHKSRTITFYNKTIACYKTRLYQAKKIINRLTKKPFNYSNQEKIDLLSRAEKLYVKSKKQHLERWRQMLKYEILMQYFYKAYHADQLKNYQEYFKKEESKIRKLVKKREHKIISEILKHSDGFNSFTKSIFLNTIVSRYGPHTMYFTAKIKKQFEAINSSKAFSYGIYFNKSISGVVKIDRIVPGGPAWKSGKLNKDDVVTEVQNLNKHKNKYDVANMSLSELKRIVNNTNQNKIIISVKKKTGITEQVLLVKEKIVQEANIINSFVLHGSKKIGYIYLPAFYTEWESNAPGCANDLAKEILKLKSENIEGLIIDLRNNGGGAVKEALNMAGLFIDEGPLCLQTQKKSGPVMLKDPSRGTVYDDPLLVLVNRHSASASEYFVAALKDYNRAVIVGSKTFGKASAQVVVPIVRNIKKINYRKLRKVKNLDYIKFTISMYHNLSGDSHQGEGIVPDIELPVPFTSFMRSEKDFRYTLSKKKISKEIEYEKESKIPISKLKRESKYRISKSSSFENIKTASKKIETNSSNEKSISINLDEFIKKMQTEVAIYDQMDKYLNKKSSLYKVKNNSYDEDIIRIDAYKKEVNKQLRKQISEDIYIEESYNIITDYIKIID